MPETKPIRKRGFHRALKRKEPWAVHRRWREECRDLFLDSLRYSVLNRSPFFDLVNRDERKEELKIAIDWANPDCFDRIKQP